MTVVPEIRDAVSRAVEKQAAPRQRKRKEITYGRRFVVMATLLATGSAVAAVAGAVHPWAHDDGRSAPAQAAGDRTVTLSAGEARALSVMSRPQPDGATPAELEALGTSLAPMRLGAIESKGIRVLRRKGRDVFLLVPVRGSRLPGGRHAAPGSHVVCMVHGVYRADTTQAAGGAPAFDGAGTCGTRERDLGAGRMTLLDSTSGPTRVAGVVPDKVASVTVAFPSLPVRRAKVNGNFFLVDAGRPATPAPPKVVWLDKRRQRVKPRT